MNRLIRSWPGTIVALSLLTACASALNVRWDTYDLGLQSAILQSTALRDCTALQRLHAFAQQTSNAHEQSTGYSMQPSLPTSKRRSGGGVLTTMKPHYVPISRMLACAKLRSFGTRRSTGPMAPWSGS